MIIIYIIKLKKIKNMKNQWINNLQIYNKCCDKKNDR